MRNGPYELVAAPPNYPGKKYRQKYVYEHHLVWWENTLTTVPTGMVVHHKNENKRDNKFSNLELKTVSAHAAEHQAPALTVDLVCNYCASTFLIYQRTYRLKNRLGQINFYCGRSCQVKAQHVALGHSVA